MTLQLYNLEWISVKETIFSCEDWKARGYKFRTIPGVWAKHEQNLRVMLMKIAEQLNPSAVSGTPGEIIEHPPASSQSPKLL